MYECKKLILKSSLAAELGVLARRLDRISEQNLFTRDFTRISLEETVEEVVACFPVYRTYIRDAIVGVADQDVIKRAVTHARRRNPLTPASVFDFIRSVLLLEEPEGLSEAERSERREFVMKFQQLTGPVMAKGVEDTAFYRYFPLAALGEVGGHPESLGVSLAQFHREMEARAASYPHALSATDTHDAKRSEDARARLAVLSSIFANGENLSRNFLERATSNTRAIGRARWPPMPTMIPVLSDCTRYLAPRRRRSTGRFGRSACLRTCPRRFTKRSDTRLDHPIARTMRRSLRSSRRRSIPSAGGRFSRRSRA